MELPIVNTNGLFEGVTNALGKIMSIGAIGFSEDGDNYKDAPFGVELMH